MIEHDESIDDVHVTPIDDLREHDTSRFCWCRPTIEHHEAWAGAALVVHHALDGREFSEPDHASKERTH